MSKKVGFVSRVRTEGKITIPKEHRELLDIKKGDLIEVSIRKPNWWEMLDWDEIDLSNVNLSGFPKEAHEYIRNNTTQVLLSW